MTLHAQRALIFPIILSLAGGEIAAQYKSDANFGVKAGAIFSKISGIGDMLVSEGFYSGYSFTDDFRPSVSANIFFSYSIPRTPVGLEARISYDGVNSRTNYSDIEGFSYTLSTKFQTLGSSAHIKGYTYKGLYASVGIGYGWCLGSNNFRYSSNSSEIDWGEASVPTDDETADEIAESFSCNGLVYLPLAVGYEFSSGLNIEAFYRRGLNDVISTLTNRHDFGEADNKLNSFGILVGWDFAMDKPDKRRNR